MIHCDGKCVSTVRILKCEMVEQSSYLRVSHEISIFDQNGLRMSNPFKFSSFLKVDRLPLFLVINLITGAKGERQNDCLSRDSNSRHRRDKPACYRLDYT